MAAVLSLALAFLALAGNTRAAGVTIITHGLSSSVDDWVIAMAGRVTQYPRFPGGDSTCYELYFTPPSGGGYTLTWRRLAGPAPTDTGSGEILIKLDWRQLANDDYSTFQVAAAALRLLETNFIPELGGRALAELPLHLIGHSRGGSLVCEMSRILGTNGIWVDQLTTLDPHPLNNDGFDDFPFTVVDAPARTWENILFHDNYFQELNLLIHGESVPGAFVRQLLNLDGGYGGLTASHSDVHLWYHGTIDLRVPADDSVAEIAGAERNDWWTAAEQSGARAGYHYSRMGGGERLSMSQPAGAGTPRVRSGYNQRWDLGAGLNNNRASLPRNNGRWPNLIRFHLAGTNQMIQGESNAVTLHYQWAQPATSSGAVSVYLDRDFNPWNGGEQLVLERAVAGTGANAVNRGTFAIHVEATNTSPGLYALCGRITGGGRARYLYAPEILEVLPASPIIREQPATQTVAPGTNVTFSATVTGTPPLQFQWFKDSVSLDGSTNASLPLLNVSTNDSGDYFLVVSNLAGSVTSVVAKLIIAFPPAVVVDPTNRVALAGQDLSLPVAVSGTAPFSYQWFRNGRLLRPQTNEQLFIPNAPLLARGVYQVEVRNVVGTIRSDPIAVAVVRPPAIVRSPRSLSVRDGGQAVFRVYATGSRPFLFQWFKNSAPIDNATNRLFSLFPVAPGDAGSYSVRVSNIGATAESAPAILTVLP